MSGFNTRVEYRGDAYIVQTQDKGPSAMYVESLIYRSGQLLASKRSSYTALLNTANLVERVEEMMEDQHKSILEEIVQGRFA
jgi:ketol-acid reductoisomerase